MARQVLPLIDLRTGAEREGITKRMQTVQSIANILKTVGEAEQKRRDRQMLDRITRAIAGGATTAEAIAATAGQAPQLSPGIPGILQRIGGASQPQQGGVRQSIQQAIIGQRLQQALAPKPLLTGEERRKGALIKAGIKPRATVEKPAKPKYDLKQINDYLWGLQHTKDNEPTKARKSDLAVVKKMLKAHPGWKLKEVVAQKYKDVQWPWSNVPEIKQWVLEGPAGEKVDQEPAPEPTTGQPTGLPAPEMQLQSAPDMKLDEFWDQLSDEQKKQIWQRFNDDPASIGEILEMINAAA